MWVSLTAQSASVSVGKPQLGFSAEAGRTAPQSTPSVHTDCCGCVNWLPESLPDGEIVADKERW